MMNSITIVGKLDDILEIENNTFVLVLKVNRTTKNEYGVYECDYISVLSENVIPKIAREELEKGMTIGVRGSLEKRDEGWFVIGNKISYLSISSK